MIVASDIIASIANDLSRSKEANRAKKLIFYISQRYWESDFSVVDSYGFEALLQNLYENNPTIEDIKALLYHAVNTLNRKAVYTKIAKYVLQRMSELYNEENGVPPADSANQANQFEHEAMDRIIENIFYHEESVRMRKLMFAVCKQYWENDINVIEMYDMRELILELRQVYPTTKRLRKALDSVVATINRQNFYSFIADTIVAELNYLYQYETSEATDDEELEEGNTVLIKAKSPTATPPTPPTPATPPTQVQRTRKPERVDAEATMVSQAPIPIDDQPESEDSYDIVPISGPEGQVIPWLKIDNLYDLKQEIMQYTNPLRAKIMLFYAIYQIDTTEQHWSIVRTCTLDDLLIRMFQHHGKDISQIESQLMEIANSSIEGLEPEDNLQAVSAIVESIKHFYKKK